MFRIGVPSKDPFDAVFSQREVTVLHPLPLRHGRAAFKSFHCSKVRPLPRPKYVQAKELAVKMSKQRI
jgi:hypothetical protein